MTALLLLSGCTVSRMLTYPKDDITTVRWYHDRITVPGAFAPIPTADPTIDPSLLASFDEYAEEHRSTALVVEQHGAIVHTWYADGFEYDSVSNSMSMTKTICALLVGIAVDRGILPGVDAKASQWIEEWRDDPRKEITVAHLLHMTSGLRNDERAALGSDLVHLYGGRDVWDGLLQIPAERPPGEVYDYNNADTQALGLILERATGKKYPEILSEWLWKPLGGADIEIWPDRKDNAHIFCCTFAPATEWSRIGRLFLNHGRVGDQQIVSEGWLAAMSTGSAVNDEYGYQLWLGKDDPDADGLDPSEPYLDPGIVIAAGRGEQRVYAIPSIDVVVVRIGEADSTFDDAVIPNGLVRSVRAGEAR